MSFDFDDVNGLDLPETQSSDYSTSAIGDGVPDTLVNVERSDGLSWTGVLENVKSTADTLSKIYTGVYSVQSANEDRKFQQKMRAASMELRDAELSGTLDIKRAQLDANRQIEIARAQRQVNDQVARTNSGDAGFVKKPSKVSPVLLIGGAVVLAAGVYFMGRKRG